MKRNFFSILFSSTMLVGYAQTDSLEGFNLPLDTFDNGSAQSGQFVSEYVTLSNTYTVDTTFGDYWSGFAISSMRDDSTSGFMNQYSAIAASGVDGSSTYALGYPPYTGNLELKLDLNMTDGSIAWNSIWITNSTYAYLSMLNGDGFGKKYGGSSGSDPDFLVLHIIEATDSNNLDTIDFYLADFRGSGSEDYIVKAWKEVDLSAFDTLSVFQRKLRFAFSSSDTAFGYINTPTYFCLDNLSFTFLTGIDQPKEAELEVQNLGRSLKLTSALDSDLSFYSLDGRLIHNKRIQAGETDLQIGNELRGYTIMVISNDSYTGSYKIYFQ